jgi:hypothetical protein
MVDADLGGAEAGGHAISQIARKRTHPLDRVFR